MRHSPWPSDRTLWAIEREIARAEGTGREPASTGSLLEGMTETIKSGKMSYYAFVAASIPAVGWWYTLPPFPQAADTIAQWCPYPNLVIGGIYACLAGLVWWWSDRVDRRMDAVAQKHWQRHRATLRQMFTDARTKRELERAERGTLTERDSDSFVLR